jgi:hypothetical protein
VKYLFLVIAALIAVSSAAAYHELGLKLFGFLGGVGAIAVFALVQGFELKPIFLTGGHCNIFGGLSKAIAGRPANLPETDPEELLDASAWATFGYAVDFVAGLIVWPVVDNWALIRVGGLTYPDVNLKHLGMILACVFLLQWCVQQYLRRGGKLFKRMGANVKR